MLGGLTPGADVEVLVCDQMKCGLGLERGVEMLNTHRQARNVCVKFF